jgi:hypothetical protein
MPGEVGLRNVVRGDGYFTLDTLSAPLSTLSATLSLLP